jgi:hypothetical protein
MKDKIKIELERYIDDFDNDKVFYPKDDKQKKIVVEMFDELFRQYEKLTVDSVVKSTALKEFINKTLEE